MLSELLGACPLSTGDIFRAASERAAAHSWVTLAQEKYEHGELVPDDIVLHLIHDRLSCLRCAGGFLLDGFPRTLAQAATLDGLLDANHLRLDAVIAYSLSISDLTARAAGRRVCVHCHAPYHVESRPPRKDGICDHCGGAVVQRIDDRATTVRARLVAYFDATARVADYYARQDLLVSVPAAESPEHVFHHTLELLAKRGLDVPPMEPARGTDAGRR
jgi:adenylate kinase